MKHLLFFVFGCFASLYCAAQVQLLDLSVTPLINNNSSDSVQLLIQFKMNPAAQGQTIEFKFSTQTGQGDVLTGSADIIQQGQELAVSYDGQQIQIKNYEAQIKCTLSQTQNNTWKKLAVYLLSPGGTPLGTLTWNNLTGN